MREVEKEEGKTVQEELVLIVYFIIQLEILRNLQAGRLPLFISLHDFGKSENVRSCSLYCVENLNILDYICCVV